MPTRRPLGINAGSSNRARPIITSAADRPPSPLTKNYRPRGDEGYYLQPATSSARGDHRRNYSAGTEDMARVATGDPAMRDRIDRGGYPRSGISRERRGYNFDAPPRSVPDDEDDRGYEYTDRREQMYRDTVPRPRPRGDSYNGRRPLSMTGMEDYLPRVPAARDARPPVTNRGFDRIGRTESLRQGSRYDDVRPTDYTSDRSEPYEVPRRRPSTRKTVAVHQEPEEGYKSYRENYDDGYEKRPREGRKNPVVEDDVDPRAYGKRDEPKNQDYGDAQTELNAEDKHRRHRKHRHRHSDDDTDRDRKDRGDPPKDKHDRGEELLAGGLAAAGVAGVAAEESKHRRRRDRDLRDPNGREAAASDLDRAAPIVRDPIDATNVHGDTSDEERRERRARHRERRRLEQEAREREQLEARERIPERPRDNPEPGRVNLEPPVVENQIRKQPSYERTSREEPPHMEEAPRRHRPRRREASDSDSDTSSTDTDREPRPNAVRVVSPPTSQEPEPPKKGILRPPREKFPEDPMPVREGVAPLKDAGKKGIPPNARWTKINRELVNPEALTEGNERFEERVDYVIVLRVLTKEEIQEYAKRTQQIRGERARSGAGVGDLGNESH
ncbi:hypothetical protein MMC08_002299 [Hypocenomyce scalaris]|nr:hypothetical protein [Hypocenomyce scalaris]